VSSVPLDVPIVATPGGGKTNVSVICNAIMLSDVIRPTMAYSPMLNERVNNCKVNNTIDLDMLKFVDIKIAGLDSCVSALADSGSEINVAKLDVLSQLNLTSFGSVQLRGILGAPSQANLVQ